MKLIQSLLFSTMFIAAIISRQPATAQSIRDNEQQRLIEASQAAATPLYFDVNDSSVKLVQPGKYKSDQEFYMRQGLPNFFRKAKNKQPVSIGYIGGSITQGDKLYRNQSAKYIQSMFPRTPIKGINAGVSGTGTDLGACRLYEQLLQHKPDLIFIEFAVNGAFKDGMEGMIRQIWKFDPHTDICLLYTISAGQTTAYLHGRMPEAVKGLEELAAHYQLPSIHLGDYPAFLEAQNKLVWKARADTVTDKIVFSNDGLHPTTAGGNVYAAAISRAFEAFKKHTANVEHKLPAALIADNWEDAKMLDPLSAATFDKGWQMVSPVSSRPFKQFRSWFPYVMSADQPGQSFSFRFEGKGFGFFDIGGPEAGQVEIELDGKHVDMSVLTGRIKKLVPAVQGNNLVNRFNNYCNNRYRGQYEFFSVEPGLHEVRIVISGIKADKRAILGPSQLADITANSKKYDQTAFYLGKILLRGNIVK